MSYKTCSDTQNSHIVLLGTGTPNAEPERSGPSIAIIVNNIPYIVDFGPGVIRQAAATGLKVENLKIAFLTHLHSDHTIGYPDLILTPWVLGRDELINVFGPKGLKKMTGYILSAYQEDIKERVLGLEPANDRGYRVEVTEIEPGIFYEDSNVKVEVFPVNHGSLEAFGYKFFTPDKTIVISGDTAPSEKLVEFYKGCDILIHEVYSVEGLKTRPPEWQEYHKNVHTSSYELAEIASQVQPKLLVLYHQLLWGITEEELILEIKEKYDGEVVSGKDLDRF